MARRYHTELAFPALSIEGGLLAPDFLNRIAHLGAADQTEADYNTPPGLKLRDEIGRYWKIAQNLWRDFADKTARADVDTHALTTYLLIEPLLRHVLGFGDLRNGGQVTVGERVFPIGYFAGDGRVPVIVAAHDHSLEKPDARFGDGARRRSPFLLAQEYLNASNEALWAVVTNGKTLRILRNNPSLTRPAYIEADLEAIFNEGLYPDFTALWLLAHASRFGAAGTDPAECPLERWRNTAQEDGVRARDRLRDGVTEALRALGTGYLVHPGNTTLRDNLQSGVLTTQAYFEQLLRLVYRLIFLATIEDRELVFAPGAADDAKARYMGGYSLKHLRRLASRRRSHDRHADVWQGLVITFAGLGNGQAALGLPALGGLFAASQCPDLDAAQLDNASLLSAIYSLCFFRDGAVLSRVNYRDMDSEELGSVYESLLELVPQMSLSTGTRSFGFIGDEQEGSTRGNARKLTGSYYTPTSLVEELIKSALEPVIERTLREHPQGPVQALLSLSVCDPACGSGHFLLAAARRIAEEVARLKATDGNPLPQDYRNALRDVIAHCIYGVDRNPMAVELARTALWLEAYTPERPLTFLDPHLRCGDALLGVLDPSILDGGIPDKAFNALSGDDSAVANRLKRANREARRAIERAEAPTGQFSLGLATETEIAQIEQLPDDTLEAIEAKRHAWSELQKKVGQSRARLAADLFVAAFVLPKTSDTEAVTPTSQDVWLVRNGDEPRQGVVESAHVAAEKVQAFHWWQEFPQISAKGGFDVLLGNPPWERIKLQEEEFFATRSRLVADSPNKAERARRIALLAQGMLLHTMSPEIEASLGLMPPNPAELTLHTEFITTRRTAEALSLFARESKRYPLSGVGDINVASLFAETFYKLLSLDGMASFLVPSGIATDDTTKNLFSEWMTSQRLKSLFEFENEGFFIGAGKGHMVRFALVTLLGPSQSVMQTRFLFKGKRLDDLRDERRQFVLSPSDIALVNPNTNTCPIFQCTYDAEITKKLYKAAPIFVLEEAEYDNPVNSWGVSFLRMLDMSNSSGLFKTYDRLEAEGFHLKGNYFYKNNDCWLPLYEGKMVSLWNHRHGYFKYSPTGERPHVLPAMSEEKLRNPKEVTQPYYWVSSVEVDARLIQKEWKHEWLIGWRDVADARASVRTLIACVIPKVAVNHKFLLMLPKAPVRQVAALLANLSSLVCDYIARQKVGGLAFTYFTMKQLPILPPNYTEADLSFIVPRVLELTYTNYEMAPWARELGYEGEPYEWDSNRRLLLRAELDAYYARLYTLTRDELRYILDPAEIMGEDFPSQTFRVLKNNEMRDFGEYRTRRLVLEAWDKLETGALQ